METDGKINNYLKVNWPVFTVLSREINYNYMKFQVLC